MRKSVNKFLFAAVATLAFAGCNNSAKQSAAEGSAAQSSPAAKYRVRLDTSRGPVVIEVDPALAPRGAQHFYDLVNAKYYDGARFYRVVPGFVVQWGAAANPAVTKKWSAPIPDDPVKGSNTRGTVTFASTMQPNTRSTHLFISLGDNAKLDSMGFAPIGRVVSGMNVVDDIYPGFGEEPNQDQIAAQGNAYLEKNYPQLDYIKTARIVP
jgi:peptidyl-prolyl cis-trans isomerase A (cyclophilin A)